MTDQDHAPDCPHHPTNVGNGRLPEPSYIEREMLAAPGWFAYYANVEARELYALPVIAWVTVRFFDFDEDDEPIEVNEIRPHVLTRSGRVIDSQEPEQDFICILGPGVEHLPSVRHLMAKRYPESGWAEAAVTAVMN